jgi:hypothetical protein
VSSWSQTTSSNLRTLSSDSVIDRLIHWIVQGSASGRLLSSTTGWNGRSDAVPCLKQMGPKSRWLGTGCLVGPSGRGAVRGYSRSRKQITPQTHALFLGSYL